MSKNSPNSKSEFVEEKRKLLYWITRWTDEETHFDDINLDLPEMSALLQSMGFRLETFEKALECENVPIIRKSPNMAERNMMKIELTCPKSGMRSCMIKQTPNCKCPSEEEVDKGQFWCITGCGPSSQSSINTSNSSLLPTITPAKSKIVKGLLSKALMVINGTDVSENEDLLQPTKNTSLSLTRHRSLDTLKNNEESVFSSRGLKRGPSWEVDPKTSPPTQTSSPVPSLCATMSRISISSGQANNVVKNLDAIKKLVDETLEIASGNNATFVKSAVPKKRVSDIKPAEGPCASDLIQLSTPPGVTRATPRRLLTPKKIRVTPGEKKDAMVPPSKIAMFRKKAFVSGVSPNAGKLLRKDTPRPRTNLQNSGSCESIFKSKIATGVGARTGLSPKLTKANEASTSGVSRLKSVSKLTLNAITPARKKT